MKGFVLAIGAITLVLGGSFNVEQVVEVSHPTFEADIDYIWRAASGPNGERDVVAQPLYEAILVHDIQEVSMLLEKGLSPNSILYPGGWSPLMVALRCRDAEMVGVLLTHGADPNYISAGAFNETPLDVAMGTEMIYQMQIGVDRGRYDISRMDYLIDHGADVNLEYRHERDIAINAAILGQLHVVNHLLLRGYRRDLVRLREILLVRIYDDMAQGDKEKALTEIDHLLKLP